MNGSRIVPHAVCLGCGCACDDIEIHVQDDRIVEARHACALGAAWYGDGRVPALAIVNGVPSDVPAALAAAAGRLTAAAQPLVYLAPDLTCEAQRAAVALADHLRATMDSVTSAAGLRPLLAAQERGRAGATLGEIRNRADVLVFWGVDPAVRYPRFPSRYAPDPRGLHVPGRPARTLIAVDVGETRGPGEADHRFAVSPRDEVVVLTALTAALLREEGTAGPDPLSEGPAVVREMLPLLIQARYAAVIADGEPQGVPQTSDPHVAEALIAFTQALNGRTRAAAVVLRAGGNRSGADAVLTWQTGYPAAVEFTRGYPRYRPYDGTASVRLGKGDADAILVIGSLAGAPDDLVTSSASVPAIAIGPRASESPLAARGIAIDTAVPGIHEGGTALRMDDVPLPLRAVLTGPPATEAIVRALTGRIVTNQGLYS